MPDKRATLAAIDGTSSGWRARIRNTSGSGLPGIRDVSICPRKRRRKSAQPFSFGTYSPDATRASAAMARRNAATCAFEASFETAADIVIWSSNCPPKPASAARINKNVPRRTMVIATVPIAVACIPALRVKLRNTSPRKNLTLPQSKVIIASLFVGRNAPFLEPHDAATHPVDDGLVVGCDHDRGSFE